jgi:hypothetical protein
MGGVFVREVLAAMDDQQEWMAAVLLFDDWGTAPRGAIQPAGM